MSQQPIHIRTPLLASNLLSSLCEAKVWLKLESLQPTGSFKARGIGYACQQHVTKGAKRFISSSGGNAGVAVAYAGRQLKVPVIVVVPKSTSEQAIQLIEAENAEVIIQGEFWNEAHEYALKLAQEEGVYIHPFDDPLLWKGHSTLIDEVIEDGVEPDAVVLSVGGGGLLSGVVEGLCRHGLTDVPILAVETQGAASLHASTSANKLVELGEITSLATTLGAKKVAKNAFNCTQKHPVQNLVVSDLDAVNACLSFVNDHRIIVEPACGAALAAIYRREKILKNKKNVLVIVCGGVGVSMSKLVAWSEQLKS